MTKFAVAVFPDENGAYEGVAAFKDLHNEGIISVFETVVARRESGGRITFKHRDKKRIHAIAGLEALLGGILGSFLGPWAAAGGVVAGSGVGWMLGYVHKQFTNDLIENLAGDLKPGMFAVVAEISEQWNAPLDKRIEELGGRLRRERRRDVIEDLITKKMKHDCRRLRTQQRRHDEAGLRLARDKIERNTRTARHQLRRTKRDLREKVGILKKQERHATPQQKSRIDQRISQVRDEAARRGKKLQRACAMADETLRAASRR
jgi:uncharacterized membrane protein